VKPSRLLSIAVLALAGCVSSEPSVKLPVKMVANCENRAVKQTAIESIVASSDDAVQPAVYPGDAVLHAIIRRRGGVFAFWPGQPLDLPKTARALGVSGPYVTMTRVVITNEIDAGSRPIWLTISTPQGDRTVLERAFDVQDVCIEGQRDI
jgi:hypothetical protein